VNVNTKMNNIKINKQFVTIIVTIVLFLLVTIHKGPHIYYIGNKTMVKDLCSGNETELTDVKSRVLAYTMFGANALKNYGQ